MNSGEATAASVTRLAAERFRNLEWLEIHPSSGLNLLTGQNAQGKTSILEAIYLASTGRILRGSKDTNAIQYGQNQTAVMVTAEPGDFTVKIVISNGHRKQVSVNGMHLIRASDVLGRLPSVCFSAQDLALVEGEPSDRRAFADSELSQLYPSYFRHFASYKRALEQRNALLKAAQTTSVDEEQFWVWEQTLSDSGEAIRAFRQTWLAETERSARDFQARLGQGELLSLAWETKDEGPLEELLSAARRNDIFRGSTSIGPHRDELVIQLSDHLAKAHASQGQKRSIVIALKAAVLETAKSVLGYPPILLLDDVFSDLDERRRLTLVELALEQGGQIFITCTEPEQAGKTLLSRSRLFRVQSGAVTLE